jgi:hypothetical protein
MIMLFVFIGLLILSVSALGVEWLYFWFVRQNLKKELKEMLK